MNGKEGRYLSSNIQKLSDRGETLGEAFFNFSCFSILLIFSFREGTDSERKAKGLSAKENIRKLFHRRETPAAEAVPLSKETTTLPANFKFYNTSQLVGNHTFTNFDAGSDLAKKELWNERVLW